MADEQVSQEERQAGYTEDKVGDGSVDRRDDNLTDEERYEQQQRHNSAVHHGGVTQIGEFDPEQQEKDREEAREEAIGKASLNETDPALPTVTDEHLDAGDDEDDRPLDDIKEAQGDVPANEGYPTK